MPGESGPQAVHFGVAEEPACTVTVRWPDGREQTLEDVAPGQRVVIERE